MALARMWKAYFLLLGPILLALRSTWASYTFEASAENEAADLSLVEVVEGFDASLPCSIRSPPMHDVPALTLWYLGNQETPVYSYDQRDPRRPSVEWSDEKVFGGGGRAKYLPLEHPPVLRLTNVTTNDNELYRCRVDYHKSNSRQAWIRLTVIVPPSDIEILPRFSPVEIGQKNDVVCRATGGSPLATVEWHQEGHVVDVNSIRSESGVFSYNSLQVPASRGDLSRPFTCTATNNKFTPPLKATYVRNVTCGPLSVRIHPEDEPIAAGRMAKLVCSVIGSNPPPVVTWYEQGQQVTPLHTQVQVSENLTVSELRLEVTQHHHGSQMVCRAEHPTLPLATMEDIFTLNVLYKPTVHLSLGRTLDPTNLKEGIDLFFECNINANPPPYKVTWHHQGKELSHNVSAGVLVSETTLALQQVQRQRSGEYKCQASNVEGDSMSNSVVISVKYSPRCLVSPSLLGVALMETTNFTCDVDGDPANVTFKWTFNNSIRREKSQVINGTRYTQEGLRSILRYTPMSERDFGTLHCFAANEVGEQRDPCSFTIISAGPPEEVDNCTVGNVTSHSIGIVCLPGFDGGLPQRFMLKVYQVETGELVYNASKSLPIYLARPLDSGHTFKARVVAYNSRGISGARELLVHTLKKAEMHKSLPSKVEPSPLVLINGVVVGMVAVTVVIFLAVLWRVKISNRSLTHGSSSSSAKGRGGSSSSSSALTQIVLKDNNPDLIISGGGASQAEAFAQERESLSNEGYDSMDEGRQTSSGQMYDDARQGSFYGSSQDAIIERARLPSKTSCPMNTAGGGGKGGGGGGGHLPTANLLLHEEEIDRDLSSSSSSSSSMGPKGGGGGGGGETRDLRRQTLVRLLTSSGSSPPEAYF